MEKHNSKWSLVALFCCLLPGIAIAGGLNKSALAELEATGLNKYLGQFTPTTSEELSDGWVKHTFDAAAGHGPVCITGTDYSVYTRRGKDRRKLLIMLQGGGACWQNLYQCSLFAEDLAPPFPRVGMWDFDNKANPFRSHSIVYMPYCDGSVFIGDNEVQDDKFSAQLAKGEDPVDVEPVRYHRGLRNLSAGMDVAKAFVARPRTLTLAGTSAGGVGVESFAPFLARFQWGNKPNKFTVINDAGPFVSNPLAVDAAMARAADWAYAQYYPESCTDCDPLGDSVPIVMWRLANDSSTHEAFYSTDGDTVAIGFHSANIPGNPFAVPFDPANGVFGLTQATYRALFVPEHGKINEKFPGRYKRFVVSGDDSHTALQTPLFYEQRVNGMPLNAWIKNLLSKKEAWQDIVEDFEPLP